jgi:superfamily II DNA or RNA helicase
MELRNYQSDCLALSLKHYQMGVNRQLAVLATGLGKTAIAANVRAHHGFTKKIIFLVHMETLAVQAATAMQRWNPGLRIGVEMAGNYADLDGFYPPDFVVASVPTLGRKGSDRIKRFLPADFDCIIQDEAHIGISDSFKRVYAHFGLLAPNSDGALFLGITATPNRTDGKGLRELFDVIVFDMGIQKGIADGWLCDLVGYRVNGKAKLDGVHTRAGDFAIDELEKEVNTPARNAIIVKEWYKVAYGKRTLIFTVDVQHALDLAAAFVAHGESAHAVWGDDPDRHQKIRGHKVGEFNVLCNCNVLGIGYDDPLIECIISAAPTKSELRYVQQVGRGTRIAPGKEACIVIDVVDNSSKHSLTTISTLLGLPKQLDLKGEKYTVARQRLDRIAAEFPTANVQDIKSLNDLKSIAENISLFQVSYPPEISRLSELAWRKSADGYMLAVNRDLVTISKDLREEWQIRGRVGDVVAKLSAQNLPGAMNLADRFVLDHGGIKGYLARDARWKTENVPPTGPQLGLCKRLKITVPPGMTKGQVSAAIDARMAQMNANQPAAETYHGEF